MFDLFVASSLLILSYVLLLCVCVCRAGEEEEEEEMTDDISGMSNSTGHQLIRLGVVHVLTHCAVCVV